jgi:hypothetical protein
MSAGLTNRPECRQGVRRSRSEHQLNSPGGGISGSKLDVLPQSSGFLSSPQASFALRMDLSLLRGNHRAAGLDCHLPPKLQKARVASILALNENGPLMDELTKEALANFSKALADVTDIFHKVTGPIAEEFGLLLGDKAREYRLRNLAGAARTSRIHFRQRAGR